MPRLYPPPRPAGNAEKTNPARTNSNFFLKPRLFAPNKKPMGKKPPGAVEHPKKTGPKAERNLCRKGHQSGWGKSDPRSKTQTGAGAAIATRAVCFFRKFDTPRAAGFPAVLAI
jgi:hypothetical protein